MSAEIEIQIESCLAYHVLRDPGKWIGAARTTYLNSFLMGVELRRHLTASALEYWRVIGVLNDPEFYLPLVAATGHPSLTIRWATAIELTHLSFEEGSSGLLDAALAWHRERGPIREDSFPRVGGQISAEDFWKAFSERPALYMEDSSGWHFYCYLAGLTAGGDWLGLPQVPDFYAVWDTLSKWSQESYGSVFGVFRIYDVPELMRWAGYPVPAKT